MFCFDHGLEYTEDQMICPTCEKEICEEPDKLVRGYVNTEDLQECSLILFAKALGYAAHYKFPSTRVNYFYTHDNNSEKYVSVKRMIKLHNTLGNDMLTYLSTVDQSVKEFFNEDFSKQVVNILNAHNSRIVEAVKGQHCKKRGGFFVYDSESNHMVKFTSKENEKKYGKYFYD